MEHTQDPSKIELNNEVVFFLGAGASVAADVPTTLKFVSKFKDWLDAQSNQDDSAALQKLLSVLGANGKPVDIELLMEALDSLTGSLGAVQALFEQSAQLSDIKSECFKKLKTALKSFIQAETLVKSDKIGYLEPLLGFMDAGVLDVFSVNYDTCIEQLCHIHRKKYTDGFEFEWWPQAFEREDLDLRLHKIHGSILWYETQESKYLKIPVPPKGPAEVFSGGLAEPLMLYPMRKWQYAEPLLELMVLLKRRLEDQTATKYIVVAGYSFRDEYIKKLFWDAFRNNKDAVMLLVDPDAVAIYEKELKYYKVPTLDASGSGIKSPMHNRVVCLPYKLEKALPLLKNKFMLPLREGRNHYSQAVRTDRSEGNANWHGPLMPLLKAGDYELFQDAYAKTIGQDVSCKDKIAILGTAIISALTRKAMGDVWWYIEELSEYTRPVFANAGQVSTNRIIQPGGIRLGIAFTINRTAIEPYDFGNTFRIIVQNGKHLACGDSVVEGVLSYFTQISDHFFALGNVIEVNRYPAIYPAKSIFQSRTQEYVGKCISATAAGDKAEISRCERSLFDIEKEYLAWMLPSLSSVIGKQEQKQEG